MLGILDDLRLAIRAACVAREWHDNVRAEHAAVYCAAERYSLEMRHEGIAAAVNGMDRNVFIAEQRVERIVEQEVPELALHAVC